MNLLSAGVALAIGFYVGTLWQGDGVCISPSGHTPPTVLTPADETLPVAATPTGASGPGDASGSRWDAVRSDASVARHGHSRSDARGATALDMTPGQASGQAVSGFDRKKLEETFQQVFGGDPNQRRQALRTLSRLGAEEIKPYLIDIASAEDEDSEIRREIIQQIDWSGETEALGNILVGSRDAEARLAAVGACSGETLTDLERIGLEDLMLDNLEKEPSDGVKIATLDYFLARDPLMFEHVLAQHQDQLATPEVQRYVESVFTPPDPAPTEPAPMEGAGN